LVGGEKVDEEKYILEMKGISKFFTGIQVLKDVNLSVKVGEVHALMGENGAGKSTLMKVLMGLHKADGGEILLNGQKVQIDNTAAALKSGITMIHQELSPIPEMTIGENIFLGRESLLKNTPFIDKKALYSRTSEILEKFNMKLNPKTKMKKLSVAQTQMIEIIKAVSYEAKIIIMDEPTSALTEEEVQELFKTIRNLKKQGVAIIYISHRMEEIYELADSITVFRDGQFICTDSMKNMTKDRLITSMVGRKLDNYFPKKQVKVGEIALQVKNLNRKGVFKNINFEVKKGEILGIAGLVGAGRSEVMRTIFGIDALDSGEIVLEGKSVRITNTNDAISHGIAMVTEDRKELGLVLCRSIKENISLPRLNKFCKGLIINKKLESQKIQEIASALTVKMRNQDQTAGSLSGGNQQKVVLAKWLLEKPKVLILDEPTRGIDVGAKAEIYKLMSAFAEEGMSIIMISSELPEVIGMSDRILVMGEGKIKGEFTKENVSQEDILKCALGGGKSA
jgi:inositol transport system ATP-binding protein